MSAIVVCGNNSSSSTTNNNHKRSFFEDLAISSNTNSSSSSSSSPPPSSLPKRLRRLSPSRPRPISSSCYSSHHFNPFYPSSPSALLLHLRSLFPAMDDQLLEKALEASGNDLNSAIKSLTELRLGSSNETTTSKPQLPLQTGVTPSGGSVAQVDDLSAPHNLPKDGSEWVEMLVREMANSSDMDDAKARATRVLEFLETSIRSRAGTEAAHNIQMENMALKEQIEALIRENTILKRAVAIQHERQKEYDERSQELQHLKQLVSQYQEQMKTLEVNNYALTAHLKQAQQSSSIPGRFHPDVF